MENTSNAAHLLGQAWEAFERDMLNSLDHVSEEQRELVKESFFAGQGGMLGLLQAELKKAQSPEAIKQALQHFRKAVEEAMDKTD